MNEELHKLLVEGAERTFRDLVETHGRDDLVGFAFYTSEDFPSVSLVGTTRSSQLANDLCTPDEALFLTDEWTVTATTDRLRTANALIETLYAEGTAREDTESNWFSDYRTTVTEGCIGALRTLVENDTFGGSTERDTLFLMLGVSDSLVSFVEGVRWSAALNAKGIHKRYVQFADTVVANGGY